MAKTLLTVSFKYLLCSTSERHSRCVLRHLSKCIMLPMIKWFREWVIRHIILPLICSGICDRCRRAVWLWVCKWKWCWPHKALSVQEFTGSTLQEGTREKMFFLVHEKCLWKYLAKLIFTVQEYCRKWTPSFHFNSQKVTENCLCLFWPLSMCFHECTLVKVFSRQYKPLQQKSLVTPDGFITHPYSCISSFSNSIFSSSICSTLLIKNFTALWFFLI